MPADQGVRLKALDPQRSFVVQAPAGSGKTEVLTQRFLRLLATVDQPERVLAITFTRKATQEMRTRITSRLTEAMAGKRPESEHDQRAFDLAITVLERDRKRNWNLLSNPGRLRIATIDGLCVQLLSRDPVHGPLWSGVRVLEDPRPLYREAISRMFVDIDTVASDSEETRTRFAQDALVRVLVRLGGDGRRLEKLLMDMLSRRNLWQRHINAGHEGFSELKALRQRHALESFESSVGVSLLREALDLLQSLGVDLDLDDKSHEARLRACYRLASLLSTQQKKPRKPGGITRRLFPGMDTSLDPALKRLKEIYQQWHESERTLLELERMASWPPLDPAEVRDPGTPDILDDVRTLLSLVLYELGIVSAERGEADFTAVSDIAVESLGTDTAPGEALLAEDNRIDHVLMDEFQDTSYTQFRLLMGLTAGWQPGDGRTLFLVGDPMQSIYRFREANVGFFSEVVDRGRFGGIELESLSLTSNFRSRRELIAWFNDTFPRIFPDHDESDSGAVSYTAVHPELNDGGLVGLHAFRAGGSEPQQYQHIARLIEEKVSQSPGQSVAVLVRSRTQIPHLTAELDRNGIDYEAVAMQALGSRPVVMDLRILTRALVHPMDRIAWIAMLRAPWCGLSVSQIHRVVGSSREDEIAARISTICESEEWSADSRARLMRLDAVMRYARQLAPSQPLSRLVEMCWIQLGGPLTCESDSDIEDVQVFLDLLLAVEQTGQGNIVEVLEEAMENQFAASRPALVKVMTIHNAKGLQFDTVIVPDLGRGTQGVHQPLIELQEFSVSPDRSGVLMAPMTPSYVSEISLYRYLNKVDEERARFEAMRLLYVACTRAKNELHLLTDVKLTTRGNPTVPANSFLGFMREIFDPFIEPLLSDEPDDTENSTVPVDANSAIPLLRIAQSLPGVEFPSGKNDGRILDSRDLPDREAAAVGMVLHEWLELVHDCPDEDWDPERIRHSTPAMRSGLLRAGAPAVAVDRLTHSCQEILADFLFNRGWLENIRAGRETGSWSELKVYERKNNSFRQHIIDLMTRGPEGDFEILDYKTRSPDEASEQKYNEQLERYRALVEKLEIAPVSDTRIIVLQNDRRLDDPPVST